MRVACIGYGSIGKRHVENLLALGCEVCVYDVGPVLMPDDCRFTLATRFSDVLHADAVVIATPADTHLHYVEKAIKHGIPFFVEKPLGTLDQLPRWREIAALDLPVNQVGYMLRFHPVALRMRAMFSEMDGGSFDISCDMSRWPGGAYASPLLECSHEIDLALWFGAPDVVSHVHNGRSITLGSWGVYVNASASGYLREWHVYGGSQGYQCAFLSPEELGTEMYRWEMRDFLHCARTGQAPVCTLTDGLKVLEVCQQVEQMAQVTT